MNKSGQNRDKRIDAYILKSAPFARPILEKIRRIVHQACPLVEETLKWNMPYFIQGDRIICHMAAFKSHCAFGFWRAEKLDDPKKILQVEDKEAMGQFGRICSTDDLPDEKIFIEYIQRAAQVI